MRIYLIFAFADVDMVTPLCSQVTYEGLLDDIFGINCGVVEFDKEVTQSDKSVKIPLNSSDEVIYNTLIILYNLTSSGMTYRALTC